MGEHDAMCEKVLRTLENIIETNSGMYVEEDFIISAHLIFV